ncbi:MAG: AraC family transcriptional regulator [Eubacteriaceae bacterium]|nr:AraC family transcriptional regulator [Eubacteriaceae bacterium]
MILKDLASLEGLKLLNEDIDLNKEIESVYIGDLLSWVMAHAGKGSAWITVQTHMNIIAVAVLLEMSCIILPENIKAEENTLARASEEGIAVFTTPLDAYKIACEFKERL